MALDAAGEEAQGYGNRVVALAGVELTMRHLTNTRALTLIELMVIVAIAGITATLVIGGIAKYVLSTN